VKLSASRSISRLEVAPTRSDLPCRPPTCPIGHAVTELIDATVVRIVLVPATMVLLGDANRWLPGWLDRITAG
jgi:hypothetical protein